MDAICPPDLVEFVGPSSPVLHWPTPGEQGAIHRFDESAVHVVWERSPLIVAWPAEWIKRRDAADAPDQ